MKNYNVVYEIMLSPDNIIECTQVMTQKNLSELLSKDKITLISVNASKTRRPRKRKTKV